MLAPPAGGEPTPAQPFEWKGFAASCAALPRGGAGSWVAQEFVPADATLHNDCYHV
jgi:hypothetical protein